MMKRLAHLIIFAFAAVTGYGQDYGNEWIDYNKQYYKIPVAKEGIYRISHADLVNAGFPVNSVDPRRLQLFHRGKELAINVRGQGDAIFNTSDYIEFYGQKNDGKSDADLYKPTAAQPHQFYNIYTDTTAYFLTYNVLPVNGKRMATFSENNINGLPVQTSHGAETMLINTDQYSGGQSFNASDVTKYSYFDYGEGWTGQMIQEGQSIDYILGGVSQSVQSAGNPRLKILLVGRDNVIHRAEIFVGQNPASLRSLGPVQFDQYNAYLYDGTINWSDINSSGELYVRISALGVSGNNDRLSISYLQLVYPQAFNMASANTQKFNLNTNVGNKSYVEVQNAPVTPLIFDITDPENVRKIGYNTSGSTINAIVDNTSSARKLWVNGTSFITPVLSKVTFQNINPANYDYIIISHPILMKPAGSVSDPVQAYADYRASFGYNVLKVDINMLYNQFNYGIVNPLAIYRFMRYMVNNGNPKYLFLIGKGIDPMANFHRNTTGYVPVIKFGVTYKVRDLVPSAGSPASDILYTAGLNGTTYEPAVPVGRLPAVNSGQVLAYLDKVREMEALPFDALWRKRLLHLSGGISTTELTVFRSYMDGFSNIAESKYLGGKSKTISKESNSTVELINVDEEVNNGLNLVTFYGHSAPSVTDIDIGYVSDPLLGYNNSGKYPFFLVNGCNAGQFFNANVLFGEDWVLAEDKGALGFIAHSSFGFASNLKKYTDTFYSTGYADSVYISKGAGDIMQETVKRYMATSSASSANITQVQQMVLLGDPAVNLFGAEKADYEINDNNVYLESFDGSVVSAQLDSFAVKVIVRNFGRVSSRNVTMRVTRTLSNNDIMVYDSIFSPVYFQDTLTMVIKNESAAGFGNNQFLVELDYTAEIDELNEGNNTAILNAFIPLFGTKNLYPVNYSIVSAQPVELLVQATDILSASRDFIIEIDTVKTFSSPFKKQNTINSKLLASWQVSLLPDIAANDSVVYFWRSKLAQAGEDENEEWVVSSFIYIKDGPEGWSQSKFSQYDENELDGLNRDDPNKKLIYKKSEIDVYVKTYGAANPAGVYDISVRLNGTEYIIANGRPCRDNTLNILSFDKSSTIPYPAIPFIITDSRTCGRLPQVINSFTRSEFEVGDENLLTCIDNINVGDSVIVFTIGNPQFSLWSAAVKNKLEEIGASTANINALADGEPYMLLGKKGASAGSATEIKATIAPADEQEIELNEKITGIYSNGMMYSTLIGPATQWQSLLSNVAISETPQTDVYGIDVYGVSAAGDEQLIRNNETAKEVDISTIDAGQYPFLRLKYNIEDDVNLTPGQLRKWQVLYSGVPEGILLVGDETAQKKERPEGDIVETAFGFKNISAKNFPDSVTVKYTLFNQDNRSSEVKNLKIKSPLPGDTTNFGFNLKTLGKVGLNDFNVFVNPDDYPEQYLENNVFDYKGYLKVIKDNINPLIDVVFDGNYIMDGDIVSPTPLISIRLKDENQFILKQDTTDVNIFLRKCETCDFKRIAFSSERLQWFPADDKNDFRVEYKPDFNEDFDPAKTDPYIYTLRVEAEDASGNASGSEPYSINFEVVFESSITNFYPYPNPFSSSTRFIFTLTGSEIPDEIKIQIMTVSGKIVREITQNELGPVRVGNNVSDFAWDGKDEFGDQLANGVYLYRVIVRQNGETLDHRETSADKAFKNGFGKMYLLR
ncbi:transporter [Fulvivirga sp. 29W222]|uniref:Transporter n=1 Tax=Fulvivirga marina TaxID=2494733 RepID=A0A937KCC1_9BACT|nr:C25 family cysteine peptidase [Fulvivirga marina]MBL6448006.1 transporter [Fulvivirga marina]